MKYLLIILLLIPFTCFSQDKMGFGNDTEGADSAGFGTVTTWVKPNPSTDAITYEGIMTVGGIEHYTDPETGYTASFYGWIVTPESFNFGSISPELETTADNIAIYFGINETLNLGVIGLASSLGGISVAPFSQTTEIIDFEIGGVDYTLTKTDYGEGDFQWEYHTFTNPFPAIGETCTIKIIYTP